MRTGDDFVDVAPTLFAVPGLPLYPAPSNAVDYLAWAYKMMEALADAIYCAASFDTVGRKAKDYIPVIGHVGLVPHYCTWTGGFKGVGKTARSAMDVWERCKRYQEVGAFRVEIEVVPPEVTQEIAKHTNLFLVSMGGGKGGDCQSLFACDVLDYKTGHVPRHSKKYADLAMEYAKNQDIRVGAFKSFVDEVQSGTWPTNEYIVHAPAEEMNAFKKAM